MNHIFLSYSRRDTDMMQRLRDDLRRAQLAVWTDENLKPGTPSWKQAIESALDAAGCVVVILSPDAKGSKWVKEELNYAENQGLRIFPVLVAGDEKSAVPFGFSASQWVDIRDLETYNRGVMSLISSLCNYLEVGDPTRFMEEARVPDKVAEYATDPNTVPPSPAPEPIASVPVDAYGRLDVYWPDGGLETYPLNLDHIGIGRSTGNTICLESDSISRYHLVISREHGQVLITDLDSVNGTYIDGVKLASNQPFPLKGREEIQIGILRIIYQPQQSLTLIPPQLELVMGGGMATLQWQAINGAQHYRLERSANARFTVPDVAYEGEKTHYQHYAVSLKGHYYRVKALAPGLPDSEWSNVVEFLR